jgi:phospholipid transport system substrate-binding protein
MKNLLKTTLLLMAFLFSGVTVAMAEDAQTVIKNAGDTLLARLAEGGDELKNDPERLHRLVNESVLPYFDFYRMSQWVLGSHWKEASEEQQQRFIEKFKELLVNTYATALLEYTDQKVEYLPAEGAPGDWKAVITTRLKKGGSTTTSIAYKMHNKDKDWKVYDVTVDGVSLIKTYRSSFDSKVKESGIEGLISSLVEKNKS